MNPAAMGNNQCRCYPWPIRPIAPTLHSYLSCFHLLWAFATSPGLHVAYRRRSSRCAARRTRRECRTKYCINKQYQVYPEVSFSIAKSHLPAAKFRYDGLMKTSKIAPAGDAARAPDHPDRQPRRRGQKRLAEALGIAADYVSPALPAGQERKKASVAIWREGLSSTSPCKSAGWTAWSKPGYARQEEGRAGPR